jgi:hypothetical protein
LVIFEKLEFSPEAQAVFAASRELWNYYHQKIKTIEPWMPQGDANASLYDIREYFQGRNETGKMKHSSQDEIYTILIADLRNKLDILAKKIEPKLYEYKFLKK